MFHLYLILALVGLPATQAATYNFYFNNVEQGENGKASPSLQVGTPGEPTPVTAESSSSAPLSPAPGAEKLSDSAAPAETSTTVAALPIAEPMFTPKKFYLDLTTVLIPTDLSVLQAGLVVAGAWQFSPSFALRAFGGAMNKPDWYVKNAGGLFDESFADYKGGSSFQPVFGSELEWSPIRGGLGVVREGFSLGVVAGVSNLYNIDGFWSFVHGGVRGRFNFAENWGVVAQTRFNPAYLTFEAGLTFGI